MYLTRRFVEEMLDHYLVQSDSADPHPASANTNTNPAIAYGIMLTLYRQSCLNKLAGSKDKAQLHYIFCFFYTLNMFTTS